MIVFKSPWLLQQPKAFAAAEFWNSVFRKLAGRKLFGREEFPKRGIRFAGNLLQQQLQQLQTTGNHLGEITILFSY